MTVSLLIATVLFAMQDSVLQAESSLVLYDESAIPPHYKPFKHFTFGNHSVTIKQNWAEQGVAGVVWDAAVVLCEYIVANPTLFLNKKVLELGSGTGLSGICAYMEGSRVTLTDRPDSLDVLKENVELNTKQCSNKHIEKDALYKVASTNVPGCTPSNKLSSDSLSYIDCKVLDWAQRDNPLFDITWDVVIAADVIYIESSFEHLLQTMRTLKYSKMLFSCRLRYAKDHKFIRKARECFTINLILYDKSRDIHIYSFSK
ncbi:METTL21A [Bugula neritina]|uniref:METTL21A n=1 Tax=Bugula neritina TaxID=10212 RepID=A0A7J7K176_BUGNE|nr:METTL21A [Bugula neritina]